MPLLPQPQPLLPEKAPSAVPIIPRVRAALVLPFLPNLSSASCIVKNSAINLLCLCVFLIPISKARFLNFHSAKLMILKGHTKEILLINVNYKIIVLKYLKIIPIV
jgi:hypothetical protein